MNKFLSVILFVAIIFSGDYAYSGAITDSEFSSATLASLNDITAKSSGGNPVGTIIAWPVAQNPEDMENWLECDGQAVNQTMYPVLYSIIGAHVPDLRGQFLRGLGGNSGKLGELQDYGTYVPNANVTQTIGNMQVGSTTADVSSGTYYRCYIYDFSASSELGIRYWEYTQLGGCSQYEPVNQNTGVVAVLDNRVYIPGGSTSVTSTQTITTGVNETRPANMAVRYLIRALP